MPNGRYGEQTSAENLKTRVVAGAAAGNITVTGIKVGDRLVAVQRIDAAAANITSEFTISAANTINNTGGTSTATGLVLVIWYQADASQSGL